MKKIINYFKSLRKSTIYKIIGIFLFLGIVLWMIFITNKMNNLEMRKSSKTTNSVLNNNKSEVQEEKNIENEPTKIGKNESNKSITNSSHNVEKSTETSSENDSIDPSSHLDSVQNQNADSEILTYFNETKNNLEDDSLREKAKENFILIVDFLFYDGKIKGYTFNELSAKTKLKVLQIALAIDSKIDTYFPGYKETISSTSNKIYTNVKEVVVTKYMEITTTIFTKDPDTCASAKNDFQEMKKSFSISWDLIKSLASKGTSNLKTWYEIYSGK